MDLDTFAAKQPRKGRVCQVCSLPPPLRKQVDAAITNQIHSRPLISQWLKSEGHTVSADIVSYHAQHGHVQP